MDTKFSVAVHTMIMLSESKEKLTSEKIALSVNTNPSYIRKIVSLLKKANLLKRINGSFEYELCKSKYEMNLLDIYQAVSINSMLNTHKNSNFECPVGKNINKVVDPIVHNAEKQMENYLASYTLNDVIENIREEVLKGE